MLIHESVGLVPISAEYLICGHVHTNGLMDGRTHRWTEELIRVGLGNLRFCQVKSFHIIWCLNPEHLLKADNSNGHVLKKESGFFFSSSFFLPVCPPENDQPAESQAHVYKDHGMGIVAWSCCHQQPPVSRFPPSPTTSCSLPPAFVCFVLGVFGCVIRGVSAARRGGVPPMRFHGYFDLSCCVFWVLRANNTILSLASVWYHFCLLNHTIFGTI